MKGCEGGSPSFSRNQARLLKTLLLELSLQEQVDRGQLGTRRLQGTGHTLKYSGTLCTHDPHPGTPTQIASDTHYISLPAHRFTITHRYRQAPWPRCRLPHLIACLWAVYIPHSAIQSYHSEAQQGCVGSQGYG